ncbi:MAG: amidase, partial [Candidatus Eisenbacteria bacterium]|nr:amidase [Candidatus Eisenbacteria bacterium]
GPASGPGRNPWDPARWTGGSSSGSGAAVGGGLVSFALGTETWGSILCPSAFCGVTGLRPTYGLVSRAGGMVGAYSFDKIGPLARSAADCRAILGAIAGPDENDLTTVERRVDLTQRRRSPRAIKAALIEPDWAKTKGAEPGVRATFERALADLRSLGLDPQPAKLPDFPAAEVSGLLITVEALSTFEHFFEAGGVKQLRDPYAAHQRDINSAIHGDDVIKAWRMRRVAQDLMAEFFEQWDVIVAPNFLSVAPPIVTDLYESLPYGDTVGAFAVACGLPGLALPMGAATHGLPCSFQLVGAPFDEALLCDLGELYQSRTRHHLARPAEA